MTPQETTTNPNLNETIEIFGSQSHSTKNIPTIEENINPQNKHASLSECIDSLPKRNDFRPEAYDLGNLIPWSEVGEAAKDRWALELVTGILASVQTRYQREISERLEMCMDKLQTMEHTSVSCWDSVFLSEFPASVRDKRYDLRDNETVLKGDQHWGKLISLVKSLVSRVNICDTDPDSLKARKSRDTISDIGGKVCTYISRMERRLADLKTLVGPEGYNLLKDIPVEGALHKGYLSREPLEDIKSQLGALGDYTNPSCDIVAYNPTKKTICFISSSINVELEDVEVDLGVFLVELDLKRLAEEWPSPHGDIGGVYLLAGPTSSDGPLDGDNTFNIHPHAGSQRCISDTTQLCFGSAGWDALTTVCVSNDQLNIMSAVDVCFGVIANYQGSDAYSKLANFTHNSPASVRQAICNIEHSDDEEEEEDDEERWCEATGNTLYRGNDNCIRHQGLYFDADNTEWSDFHETYIDSGECSWVEHLETYVRDRDCVGSHPLIEDNENICIYSDDFIPAVSISGAANLVCTGLTPHDLDSCGDSHGNGIVKVFPLVHKNIFDNEFSDDTTFVPIPLYIYDLLNQCNWDFHANPELQATSDCVKDFYCNSEFMVKGRYGSENRDPILSGLWVTAQATQVAFTFGSNVGASQRSAGFHDAVTLESINPCDIFNPLEERLDTSRMAFIGSIARSHSTQAAIRNISAYGHVYVPVEDVCFVTGEYRSSTGDEIRSAVFPFPSIHANLPYFNQMLTSATPFNEVKLYNPKQNRETT